MGASQLQPRDAEVLTLDGLEFADDGVGAYAVGDAGAYVFPGDDAVFVEDEGGGGGAVGLDEGVDHVGLGDGAVGVVEDGEGDADPAGDVGGAAEVVDAYGEDFGVEGCDVVVAV